MLDGTCHCGKISWRLDQVPDSATACNCTICRRYGILWAYGFADHDLHVTGATRPYRRADGGAIDFHFCPDCGCVTHYIAVKPGDTGRHWSAVNLRLADPTKIADLPIDHFDGLDTFTDLPRDHRTIKDMWF